MGIEVLGQILETIGGDLEKGLCHVTVVQKESEFPSSELVTSATINDLFPTSENPVINTTTSNLGSGDARDMSDSSIPRHAKPRRSRTQRRSTPHSTQPLTTTHAHSLPPSSPVLFENTQQNLPNLAIPSLHYSTSPPPHAHGGLYLGHYAMSPQPAVHSPPFPFSHTYHHPTVSNSSLIPQTPHSHYQCFPQHPHSPVYQYQSNSEGNSPLTSPFPGTGTGMYPTHQVNALGPPTSPHSTQPSSQNSPLSASYIGSGAFHSVQYPSPMSAPQYTYSPPFPGTPTYQSQYPPPQFSPPYTSNRDGEPQGDWYYFPRHSTVSPSQQYDAGPSGGRYPTAYPLVRPELHNPHSFSSVSSYSAPPSSHHSEVLTRRNSAVGTTSQSSDSEQLLGDKSIIRQPYHPNPPPRRSDWVMWAGNIPSDATHNEIYRFFSQPLGDQAIEPTVSKGVVSVFLISRSNCAFINFESNTGLQEAISRFNGVPLRADDLRCARLVCRVRLMDDDLRAGVGGQRGIGMHTRWVKEQKEKAQEKTKKPDLSVFDRRSTPPLSIPEQLGHGISKMSLSSDKSELEQNANAKHSSTSDSYSSSNSSFLARHFPKRYFILKSLTEHDLDLSVQTGLWATQKHNEGILDQSYRTSKEVYLIFGANKSGEFYGYARMAGPVRHGERSIPWAPQSHPSSSRLSSDPSFFSPGDHRLVDSSPLPVDDSLHVKTATDSHKGALQKQSAPGILGMKYDLPSMKTPEVKHSLDQQRFKTKNQPPAHKDDFELDPLGPVRAMRSVGGSGRLSLHSVEEEGNVEEPADNVQEPADTVQEPTIPHQQEAEDEEDAWGDCFAVEWISTEKLPFSRTRQIRNPWNRDREVKVSRDGTELEPTVGERLLDEWHKLSKAQPLTSAQVSVGDGKEGGETG